MSAVRRVVVVGGGVAGLVAGWECARAGADVTILEASDAWGGSVRAREVDGLRVDVGAESFATRGGAVDTLVAELDLTEKVVAPRAGGAWLRVPRRTVPMPRSGPGGIPADLSAPDVRRALGRGAAAAAAMRDGMLPAGRTPADVTVGALVRARMGRRVRDRLVEPITAGVYGTPSELLAAEAFAPGLVAAVRETGSLAGGVRRLRAGREAPAGAAVRGLAGGMTVLTDALASSAAEAGASLRPGVRADAVRPEVHGGWSVETDAGALPADAVIVALPGADARAVLSDVIPPLPAPTTPVELITLVVDAPALDAAPRGTGLLVTDLPGTGVQAKALTHATAKWPWLAEAAGPGRHVLRLSYGRPARPGHRAAAALPAADEAATSIARHDASVLLGVSIGPDTVRGAVRTRWEMPRSAAVSGHDAVTAGVRAAASAHPGLLITGAWVAGTGLAAVVPHARATASAALAG